MVYGRFKGLFTKPKPTETTVTELPAAAPVEAPLTDEERQEMEGRATACLMAIKWTLEQYKCEAVICGQFEGPQFKSELKVAAQRK